MMLRRFAYILLWYFLIATGSAQHVLDLGSADLLSGKATGEQSTFRPKHVSHLFSKADFYQTLVSNTIADNPDFFRSFEKKTNHRLPKASQIGEQKNFYVTNFQLQSFDQVTAELRSTSRKANIYVELREWNAGHVLQSQIDSIQHFLTVEMPSIFMSDSGIIDREQKILGDFPNKDGDSTLDILIYDIKDGYSTGGGFVAGYFSSVDQSENTGSNRRDIIYLDSYPTIFPQQQISLWNAIETAAHEIQHLIHYNYDSGEILFINEGLSMFAEMDVGFAKLEMKHFLKNTNVPLFAWATDTTNALADFARAQYFMLYLQSQFGTSFIKQLLQNPLAGIIGVTDALQRAGYNYSCIDIFEWWAIANQVQNNSINGRYGYGPSSDSSRPLPARTFYTDILPYAEDTVREFAAKYISVKNVGYFKASFIDSPALRVYSIYPSGEVNPMVVGTNTTNFINGVFSEVVFVLINLHPGSSTIVGYSFHRNADTMEIKYDAGVLDTLVVDGNKYTHIAFGNSVSAGGTELALAVDPPANSTLVLAKYLVGFDQERPGSTTPPNAPREFRAFVKKKKQDLFEPGENLIDAQRYTVDRKITPVNSWFEIPLTTWSGALANLKETIFIGYSDDDQYETSIGLNNRGVPDSHSYLFTGKAFDESNGIRRNRWYSFRDLQFGKNQPLVSLANWDIMIRSVWRRPISAYARENEPVEFKLQHVYPNPFREKASIEFTLTHPSEVTLKISDALGREITSLLRGRYEPGDYITSWEGCDDTGKRVPAGLYFVLLQSEKKSEIRKIHLLR